mmetsp:Transcript_18404/g.41914  ORF Transcript_18404/g.41914 Transcript_18404/m.41914 type:complete len:825 (-) Transcript_18404:1209-3683(-)
MFQAIAGGRALRDLARARDLLLDVPPLLVHREERDLLCLHDLARNGAGGLEEVDRGAAAADLLSSSEQLQVSLERLLRLPERLCVPDRSHRLLPQQRQGARVHRLLPSLAASHADEAAPLTSLALLAESDRQVDVGDGGVGSGGDHAQLALTRSLKHLLVLAHAAPPVLLLELHTGLPPALLPPHQDETQRLTGRRHPDFDLGCQVSPPRPAGCQHVLEHVAQLEALADAAQGLQQSAPPALHVLLLHHQRSHLCELPRRELVLLVEASAAGLVRQLQHPVQQPRAAGGGREDGHAEEVLGAAATGALVDELEEVGVRGRVGHSHARARGGGEADESVAGEEKLEVPALSRPLEVVPHQSLSSLPHAVHVHPHSLYQPPARCLQHAPHLPGARRGDDLLHDLLQLLALPQPLGLLLRSPRRLLPLGDHLSAAEERGEQARHPELDLLVQLLPSLPLHEQQRLKPLPLVSHRREEELGSLTFSPLLVLLLGRLRPQQAAQPERVIRHIVPQPEPDPTLLLPPALLLLPASPGNLLLLLILTLEKGRHMDSHVLPLLVPRQRPQQRSISLRALLGHQHSSSLAQQHRRGASLHELLQLPQVADDQHVGAAAGERLLCPQLLLRLLSLPHRLHRQRQFPRRLLHQLGVHVVEAAEDRVLLVGHHEHAEQSSCSSRPQHGDAERVADVAPPREGGGEGGGEGEGAGEVVSNADGLAEERGGGERVEAILSQRQDGRRLLWQPHHLQLTRCLVRSQEAAQRRQAHSHSLLQRRTHAGFKRGGGKKLQVHGLRVAQSDESLCMSESMCEDEAERGEAVLVLVVEASSSLV